MAIKIEGDKLSLRLEGELLRAVHQLVAIREM